MKVIEINGKEFYIDGSNNVKDKDFVEIKKWI
jgi:hypothetical protein